MTHYKLLVNNQTNVSFGYFQNSATLTFHKQAVGKTNSNILERAQLHRYQGDNYFIDQFEMSSLSGFLAKLIEWTIEHCNSDLKERTEILIFNIYRQQYSNSNNLNNLKQILVQS